jgi:hypothetical protein
MIGKTRQELSKMEHGLTANAADVLNLLDALGVDDERWTQLTAIARDAAESGWWDSVKDIGGRQALYANLESGATSIHEYHQMVLPGLLQIPDYVRATAIANEAFERAVGWTVEGIVTGRAARQRILRRPGGPLLEVIVDEIAVLRLAAPTGVTKLQLRHLGEVAKGSHPRITLRVLPTTARIRDFAVVRGPFSIYAYPDPNDPRVVALDTVTSDVILTDETQVSAYERLYQSLREAALSPEESAKLFTEAADALPDTDPYTGSATQS